VDAGTLELDTPKAVATTYRQQQARLTFSATAGDQLGLEVKGVTMPSGSFNVLAPNGASLTGGNVGIGPSSDFTLRLAGPSGLTLTGTYTVVITPGASVTGAAQFTLWKDVSDSLTLGTPYPLVIQYRNQQARLTFSGTAGQNLGISVGGVTLPSGGSVTVMRPDGISVFSTSFGAAGFSTTIPTLISTGTYSVNVAPSGSGTGNATVSVFNQ
jgi:hypothetical protein